MAHVPQDVLDRIRALENEVRSLRGRAQMRPALNEIVNGRVRIGEGGQLLVEAPGGADTFTVGAIGPTTYGEDEFGLAVRRRDGSLALLLWNGTDPDGTQAFRIVDHAGHEILSEDVHSQGLSRPHLSHPWRDVSPSRWPSTDSTSWTPLQEAIVEAQHGAVRVHARRGVDSSGDGEIRLLIDGSVVDTAAGNITGTYELSAGWGYGDYVTVTLEARRTGTAANVWGSFARLQGVGDPTAPV